MTTNPAEADAWVQKHLAGWPPLTRKLATQLITRYGRPQAATAHEITWYGNGSWKRTVLYRVGVKHNFPVPHEDILEQTVNYRVPVKRVGDLAAYDGSLVVDRTRGELSAHCDSEEQNRIMLNIADDIVTGQRSVDQGLAYHAQIVRGVEIHVPESYPNQLKFKILPSAQTADPGEEAPLLEHLDQS
ncbi:MAG: hypothetical protein WBE92_09105 [Steroidobacteraceae bacterium]